MRILILSDIHIMLMNPVAWVSDYRTAMKESLRWIRRLIRKDKIDLVLCAGDVFHKDTLRRPSLIVRSIVYALNNLPNMYGIVGNHDLVGNTMLNLEKSMIAPLISAGKYKLLQKPSIFPVDNGMDIEVFGYSYGEEITEPPSDADNPTFRIAVWHQLVTEGDSMFPDSITASEVLDMYGDWFDLIITGDNHKRFTVSENGNCRAKGLYNPGSMMRMTASQMDMVPQIQVYNTEENTMTAHAIPCAKWEMTREHLDIDTGKKERFAELTKTIQENGAVTVNFVKNVRTHLKKLKDIDPEVSELINEAMGELL